MASVLILGYDATASQFSSSDFGLTTDTWQWLLSFQHFKCTLYIWTFFRKPEKLGSRTPGQNDDPVTQWSGRERWPKWPTDPVTQWPSSMSAGGDYSTPPNLVAGGEGAGCPSPRTPPPNLGHSGLALTRNNRLGPHQHDGLYPPMRSAIQTDTAAKLGRLVLNTCLELTTANCSH